MSEKNKKKVSKKILELANTLDKEELEHLMEVLLLLIQLKSEKRGDGLASRAYQAIANKYRKAFCSSKARKLEDGELHPMCFNYCGPGTRIDLKSVRDGEPYDRIDSVCKQHDIDYYDAQGKPDKEKLIRKADRKMLDSLEKYKNDKGYNLAKLAIAGKVKAENLLGNILKNRFSEHFGSD